MPVQAQPNVPAGYDPLTGIVSEIPWYDPNRPAMNTPTTPPNPLLDLVTQLLGQRRARPDLVNPGSTVSGAEAPRLATFAGRVISGPESPTDVLKRLPTEAPEGEGMQSIAKGIGAALMAKQFKPGPATLEGLVANMVKSGDVLPNRTRLIPAIRVPGTGEVFEGAVGASHPTEALVQAFTQRRTATPSMLEYGFKRPGESVFLPESLANLMRKPEGISKLNKLLEQGISPETILSVIGSGKQLP